MPEITTAPAVDKEAIIKEVADALRAHFPGQTVQEDILGEIIAGVEESLSGTGIRIVRNESLAQQLIADLDKAARAAESK